MVRSISQKRYVILSGKAREGGDVNQSSFGKNFFLFIMLVFLTIRQQTKSYQPSCVMGIRVRLSDIICSQRLIVGG